MTYGYGNKTNWKLQAEAQAVRQEARTAAALTTKAPGPAAVQGAEYDEKAHQAVSAQINVKFNGQYVGRGWRKMTKYGPCLTLQLEQDVPAGGKLLIVPRKQFPDCLGRT